MIDGPAVTPQLPLSLRHPSDQRLETFVGAPAGVRVAAVANFPAGGLSVAAAVADTRAIVDAHDGTIAAANRPQGGACVSFTLPLGEPPLIEDEVVAANAGHPQ